MKKAVLYIAILGVVCMGLGIAVGIVINRAYTRTHLIRIIKNQYLGSNAETRQQARNNRIIKRLSRNLNLSKEQAGKIKDIVKQARPEIDQFRENVKNDFIKIKRGIIADIYEVLDSEQKEKYQALVSKKGKIFRQLH